MNTNENKQEIKKLHSEAYFTDHRDFWWNRDFLRLMSTRWDLNRVQKVLDIGCGQGHWGRILLPLFERTIDLIGVDSEPKWIEVAREKAAAVASPHKLQYQIASVEKLPFPDNTFDMVTCQTVLIHVKDPIIALREMVRVLKPGGLLIAAEPNNAAPIITLDTVKKDMSLDDRLRMVRLQLTCDLGKEVLGEGNNLRGDLLPHFFHSVGLSEIQSYLSDMADYYVPPYSSPRERAGLESMISEIKKGQLHVG